VAVAGNLYQLPLEVDYVILGSYNPDPLAGGCGLTPYSMFPGASDAGLTIADTIRSTTPNWRARILLSVGGSPYGRNFFCPLVLPWITAQHPQLTTCNLVLGTTSGFDSIPCGSPNGFEANQNVDLQNTVCIAGTYLTANGTVVNITSTPYFNNFTYGQPPGFACSKADGNPRFVCTCCCGNNYQYNSTAHALKQDPCYLIGGAAAQTYNNQCGNFTGANTSTALMATLMFNILTNNHLDGIDFDYEDSDDNGYIAEGLVAFARDLRQRYVGTLYEQPYLTATLMSGPTYGIWNETIPPRNGFKANYSPFYKCFHQMDCPFNASVPMPYDNCMYQFSHTPVYVESPNLNHDGYTVGAVTDPGFTFESIMDPWTTNYIGCTNTQLIVALSAIQHWNRYPCEFLLPDIAVIQSKYMNTPPGVKPINGAFFWYYETPDASTPAANTMFEYNNTITTATIQAWLAAFPETVQNHSWPVPPPVNCTGVAGIKVLATTRNVTLAWINQGSNMLLTTGNVLDVAAVDMMAIASYNPNPLTNNCSNPYSLLPDGNSSGLPIVKNIKVYTAENATHNEHAKILLSLGGSQISTIDWCALAIPYITYLHPSITSCALVVNGAAGGAGPSPWDYCNASWGASVVEGNATCPSGSGYYNYAPNFYEPDKNVSCCCPGNAIYTPAAWPHPCVPPPHWSNPHCQSNHADTWSTGYAPCAVGRLYYHNYTDVWTPSTWPDPNQPNLYTCCCTGNNYTNLTGAADVDICNGGGPEPPAGTGVHGCDSYAVPVTRASQTKVMADILINNHADGYDLDYEPGSPNTDGLIAEGLVQFALDLKAYMLAQSQPAPTLIATLVAGPGRGDATSVIPSLTAKSAEYAAFYACFHRTNCPLDYVVPMLYDTCQYQSKTMSVFTETQDPVTRAWVTTTQINNGGFTMEGLLDAWVNGHMGCTNTQLLLGANTAQHFGRTPCIFLPSSAIPIVQQNYRHIANFISGAAFWWYLENGNQADVHMNSSLTSTIIQAWTAAFPP
jgi:hypothetical protein